jgi:SAM-dependent MidA family methyltransferase
MGTLMCHYQHQAHADPLVMPGLQDITAHVDFSTLGDAAQEAGLSVDEFTTQARYLLAMGLTDLMTASLPTDVARQYNLAQQIKRLTMPQEMGELFKVMILSRSLHC